MCREKYLLSDKQASSRYVYKLSLVNCKEITSRILSRDYLTDKSLTDIRYITIHTRNISHLSTRVTPHEWRSKRVVKKLKNLFFLRYILSRPRYTFVREKYTVGMRDVWSMRRYDVLMTYRWRVVLSFSRRPSSGESCAPRVSCRYLLYYWPNYDRERDTVLFLNARLLQTIN